MSLAHIRCLGDEFISPDTLDGLGFMVLLIRVGCASLSQSCAHVMRVRKFILPIV